MGDRNARGFSLLETVVAVGIAVVLAWVLFHVLSNVLVAGRLQSARDQEQSTASQLIDNLTSEEDDAWAIFTPPTDVLGTPNGDGHEADFFARDGKQQPYFWAYTYNAAAHTLTRYRYAAVGSTPVKDVTYTGITKFFAHTYPVTALQDTTTPLYSPLYNGASLQSGIVHFYPSMPWIAGGNNITYVHFEGTTLKRDLQLVTQTAPTGFTVVLNYTPTPAPSSTPGGLQAWPAFVELPVGGQALQTAYAPVRPNFGSLLNQLIGGGVAQAALTPCATNQARAFTDSNFTSALANATPPPGAMPAGVTASTDSSGCITINDGNGSNVELYEAGNMTAMFQKSGNCGSNVVVVSASPVTYVGTNVGLRTRGGSSASAYCSEIWADSNTTQQSVPVYFQIAGCTTNGANYTEVGIGEVCAIPYTYSDSGGGGCDGVGGAWGGYTGTGMTSVSGPGSWDGANMTRTGNGTITLTVRSRYQQGRASLQRSGGYTCSYTYSYSVTSIIYIYD